MAFGRTLTIFSNFLLVPLFLLRWDKTTYGEWLILSSMVAYLSTTDLGVNTAAVNEMAAAYARNDLKRYRAVQSSASLFYILLTAVGLALTAVICLALPFPAWMGLKSISSSIARAVTWILAARLLLQMLAYQVCGIFRSVGQLARTEWIWNVQFLLGLSVTGVVLLAHGGPSALAAWSGAPLVIVTGVVWCALYRSRPELLPRLSEARLVTMSQLVKPSLGFGAIMIAAALAFNGPILIASRAVGGAAIALAVSTRTLTNAVRQLVQILNSAIWPELTRLHALGARGEMRSAYRCLSAASITLCTALAGTLWFEGPGIVRKWTGGILEPDVILLRLFLVAMVLQAPWIASSLMNMATNQNKTIALLQLGSAVLTVAVTAALLPFTGTRAIPIGVIIGEGIFCYHFVPRNACGAIGADYSAFAGRAWATVVVMSLTALATAWFAHIVGVGPSPLRWLQTGCATLCACGAVGWRFGLPNEDRVWISKRLRSIMRRFSGAESRIGTGLSKVLPSNAV
jgi:O-antigen/teichoic acid export membrane protein